MDKKEYLHKLYHKMELIVDKIVPYLVILLLVLIILDLAFKDEVAPYEVYITLLDYFVLAVFCIDLAFKYIKVRKIPTFLRRYWLDILAVFPFFILFRLFEQVYLVASLPQLLKEPPTLLHESIVLEREGIRLMRAAEKTEKVSRTKMMLRLMKPLQRFPRLLKIIPYYERPTKEHHKTIEEIAKEKLKKR